MGTAMDIKRVGYLSGAPRVSTLADAELAGPRSHVLGVIDGFKSCGCEVLQFIVGDRVPPGWRGKGSERLVSGGSLNRLAADILRLALAIRNKRLAWRELRGKVDCVYERYGLFQGLGSRFQRHGIPWILETNAPLSYESSGDRRTTILIGMARRMEAKAYELCDVLVCVSDSLKQVLVEKFRVDPGKIIVMPNAADTGLFDPTKHKPRRIFKGFTVGYVGTITRWQGLDSLIDSVSELSKDGKDVNLVLVGDGPFREELERKSESVGLKHCIRFIGAVARSEIPSYVAGFDVGYSGQTPLEVGGMYLSPLKLYEYMAMAKPVIASSHEDAERLVEHGLTGFLFAPGDREQLKTAILRANKDVAVLQTMGERARGKIVAEHSWSVRVERMIGEFERVLHR